MKDLQKAKKQLIESVARNCSQILIFLMDRLEIENFIEVKMTNIPDGREFKLRFECTKKLNEIKSQAHEGSEGK